MPRGAWLPLPVNVGPSRHDDDGSGVVQRNDLRKQVEALPAGSRVPRVVQVNEQGIIGAGGQRFANQGRGSRGLHFVALRAQQEFDGFENMLLVVGRQDTGAGVAALALGRCEISSGLAEVCMVIN